MNQKYKPGLYFGIYCMVLCIVFELIFKGAHITKFGAWSMFVSSLIGGAVGGFMFGWIWNSFRTQKEKSV